MDAVVRAGVEATGHFRSTPGLLTELLHRGSWQVCATRRRRVAMLCHCFVRLKNRATYVVYD